MPLETVKIVVEWYIESNRMLISLANLIKHGQCLERHFLGSKLTMVSLNTRGLTFKKENILSN